VIFLYLPLYAKILNHVARTTSGVAAICKKSEYEKECCAAIKAWQARLKQIPEQPWAAMAYDAPLDSAA
jgi:hypothetical protein